MKLGKQPHTPDDRDLMLARYLKTSVLPKPPKAFGHEKAFPTNGWGMLGNDQYGDCVWAGAGHESMLWNAEAKHPATFTDASVLSDYSAATGFNPNDPNTDQGTNVRSAMSYRQKTGVLDAHGQRHRIAAYAAVDPKDWTTLMTAVYLFGAVGVGIEFPRSAMDQFNAGMPWRVTAGSSIEGGHYVPLVARRGMTRLVTWGRCISASQGFLLKYMDEAWVPLSEEALVHGRSLEGFDVAALEADLRAVSK